MNKKIAHNWYWIVGVSVVGLLAIHYSGVLSTSSSKSDRELAVNSVDIESLQAEVQKDLEEALAFEEVATSSPEAQTFDTEGYTETASGLLYKVIRDEQADQRPNANSRVTVHYVGTLADGSEFDSSRSRGAPSSFGLNQVIAGWTEGLQLMSVGDVYEFVIPAELAYGQSGHPLSGETLKFEVELLGIE